MLAAVTEREIVIAPDGRAMFDIPLFGGASFIPHIDSCFSEIKLQCSHIDFDDWNAAIQYMNEKRKRYESSPYMTFDVYGYELVHDNHYIAIYYKLTPLFT